MVACRKKKKKKRKKIERSIESFLGITKPVTKTRRQRSIKVTHTHTHTHTHRANFTLESKTRFKIYERERRNLDRNLIDKR